MTHTLLQEPTANLDVFFQLLRMKQNLKIPVFHRSENQSSVGEITLQGKITSLDLSPGKYVTIIFH